ncbi:MAG: rhodanese-like domain-containing protein [Deltaproteobacteria bacterium]|nr:rhodanese-like domain-containing protein [Deltaproteobacteria bacterium]
MAALAVLVSGAGNRGVGFDPVAAVKNGGLLLDVRTSGEYSAGHVAGALNISVDQLESRLSELGPKDRDLIVYCHSGTRSARAARILSAAGFTRVHDLGPMSSWPGG